MVDGQMVTFSINGRVGEPDSREFTYTVSVADTVVDGTYYFSGDLSTNNQVDNAIVD